jgi:hypothetical protein
MLGHNLIQMTRFCNDLYDGDKIIFCKVGDNSICCVY